jgi:preprotein translocase subunit SecG
MGILSILLSIILFLDCLFLILLVLVQLPKKETGIGMAFGGGTADALFGAGSGTALTKLTKYAAVIFFVGAFLLSIVNTRTRKESGSEFRRQFEKAGATAPAAAPTTTAPTATTNAPIPLTISTNLPSTAPAAPSAGTNAPAK